MTPFLIDDKFIYVTTVNVPKTLTFSDQFSFFVEIRARLLDMDNPEKPGVSIELNNLNLAMLTAIKWAEFQSYLMDIAINHFKTILS